MEGHPWLANDTTISNTPIQMNFDKEYLRQLEQAAPPDGRGRLGDAKATHASGYREYGPFAGAARAHERWRGWTGCTSVGFFSVGAGRV